MNWQAFLSQFLDFLDWLPAPIIAILITPYIVRWWDKKFGSKDKGS